MNIICADKEMVLFFCVTPDGIVKYGINGVYKGMMFSCVSTSSPNYVVIELSDNTTSVEFVGELILTLQHMQCCKVVATILSLLLLIL